MRPTKLLLTAMLCAGASAALADGPRDGSREFLDAISLCPTAKNPLKGLSHLGGHKFGNVALNERIEDRDTKVFSAIAIHSPHSLNHAVMASDSEVGVVYLTMSYDEAGRTPGNRPLKCQLDTRDIHGCTMNQVWQLCGGAGGQRCVDRGTDCSRIP